MDAGLILHIAFFGSALAYAVAGFGGGSAYLALLVLFGVPIGLVAPLALICNIIVVSGGTYHFLRAGHLELRLFLPFALASIPMAYLGAAWTLDPRLLQVGTALVLLAAAMVMIVSPVPGHLRQARDLPGAWLWPVGILAGGLLGGLSGLIGIGGGIFLAPLLYMLRWGQPKQVAAVASLFILLNSLSGLTGQWVKLDGFSGLYPYAGLFLAVLVGGQVGSRLGAYRLAPIWIRRATATLIFIAASRMLMNLVQQEPLMGIGTTELLIILAIVLLIFGATKLPALGAGLGKGIQNFQKSVKEGASGDDEVEKQDV